MSAEPLPDEEEPPDPAPIPLSRVAAFGLVPLVIVVTLVLVVALDGSPAIGSQRTPAGTVRDFLGTAVVDENGLTACNFLTPRAQDQVTSASGAYCGDAFAGASLRIGTETVNSDAQVDGLRYATRDAAANRVVTVSGGGATMRFLLVRATMAEKAEFRGPSTPWRIASDVTPLLR